MSVRSSLRKLRKGHVRGLDEHAWLVGIGLSIELTKCFLERSNQELGGCIVVIVVGRSTIDGKLLESGAEWLHGAQALHDAIQVARVSQVDESAGLLNGGCLFGRQVFQKDDGRLGGLDDSVSGRSHEEQLNAARLGRSCRNSVPVDSAEISSSRRGLIQDSFPESLCLAHELDAVERDTGLVRDALEERRARRRIDVVECERLLAPLDRHGE